MLIQSKLNLDLLSEIIMDMIHLFFNFINFYYFYRIWEEVNMSDKDFMCEICGALFSSLNSFKNHKDKKHTNTVYYCEYCQYQTSYRFHLNRHTRSKHLPTHFFQCFQCKFQSTRNDALKVHVEAHHQNILYRCPSCQTHLQSISSLNQHMRNVH